MKYDFIRIYGDLGLYASELNFNSYIKECM